MLLITATSNHNFTNKDWLHKNRVRNLDELLTQREIPQIS